MFELIEIIQYEKDNIYSSEASKLT